MPRTTIVTQVVGAAGINGVTRPTADAVNGMQWPYNGGKRKLYVDNQDAASKTVTIKTPTSFTVDGLVVPDRVYTVAAGALLSVRESSEHLQADGFCYVDFSASTSVKVWVDENA